jgi:hypothetical protein
VNRNHRPFPAAAGIALVALIGPLALHEITTEFHHNHSANDRSEMGTGSRQAQANEVHGQAKMMVNHRDLPTTRKRDSRTKEFGRTGITGVFSRRQTEQHDLVTDPQVVLQETQRVLSTGALDRSVAETGI